MSLDESGSFDFATRRCRNGAAGFTQWNVMEEHWGHVATTYGLVPAIGGDEDCYNAESTWPFSETTFVVGSPYRAYQTIRAPAYVDILQLQVIAIDFGNAALGLQARALTFERTPENNNSAPRFAQIFKLDKGSELHWIKMNRVAHYIEENFRGFKELWHALNDKFAWLRDHDNKWHKSYDVPSPPKRFAFVMTPCGECPAANGSSDNYIGTPWPFEHREARAVGSNIKGPALIDLAQCIPLGIDFGSVYFLPRALVKFKDDFAYVTIVHGKPEAGLEFRKLYPHQAARFLSSLFCRTPAWPQIIASNSWLQVQVDKLVRQGVLWRGGWHPDQGERAPMFAKDGPSEARSWTHQGQVVSGMPKTAWKLVSFLWKRTDKLASFRSSEFVQEVFGNPNTVVTRELVGSHRKFANKFFAGNGIPWHVRIDEERVMLIPGHSPHHRRPAD